MNNDSTTRIESNLRNDLIKFESLIKFDKLNPLVSTGDKSGYRLKTGRVDPIELLDYLINEFGEDCEYVNDDVYENSFWRLKYVKDNSCSSGYKVILFIYGDDYHVVESLLKTFSIYDIMLNTDNCIYNLIISAMRPLMFSKKTSKRIRKIKSAIADVIRKHINVPYQWYDIEYDEIDQLFCFIVKDIKFRISI